MDPMNSTYLFEQFRNGESFWSTLFAIQVLEVSRSGATLKIPIFEYNETPNEWRFEEKSDEPLVVPAGLNFADIVVECSLRTGFIPIIPTPFEKDFEGLRPDIILRISNTISVIETKTIGANITEKEILYTRLCQWLKEHNCEANAYLLLSAGHEHDREIKRLVNEKWQGPKKLILWEKFFEAVETQFPNSLITRLIPNLQHYYRPEGSYMKGKFYYS